MPHRATGGSTVCAYCLPLLAGTCAQFPRSFRRAYCLKDRGPKGPGRKERLCCGDKKAQTACQSFITYTPAALTVG